MPPRRRHRGQGAAAAPLGVRAERVASAAVGREHRPLLIVDGRNVQRAAERGALAGALPTSTLIAQLRAAFADAEVELVLDGHAGGSPSGLVAPRVRVVYARAATADQVIAERISGALRSLGPAATWSVTVVSDDREVRDHALRHGARVEGTAWLVGRIAALRRPGSAIGHARPPRARRERLD